MDEEKIRADERTRVLALLDIGREIKASRADMIHLIHGGKSVRDLIPELFAEAKSNECVGCLDRELSRLGIELVVGANGSAPPTGPVQASALSTALPASSPRRTLPGQVAANGRDLGDQVVALLRRGKESV